MWRERLAAVALCVVLGGWLFGGRALAGGASGERLFHRRCATCHATAPLETGDPLVVLDQGGPDLSYAGSKFDAEWLEAWLQDPVPIRPAGFPPYRFTAPTPDGDRVLVDRIPAHPRLASRQASEVTRYLQTLGRPLDPVPEPPAEPPRRPQVHFERILPCAGCHQTAPGQGGLSGPELYTASRRLRAEWLAAYIADPTYWSPGWMPALPLRADQIQAVVTHIRDVGAAEPTQAPPAPAVAADGQARELPRDRAPRLYALLCSQCHGVRGDGRGIDAPHLFIEPRDHTSRAAMGPLGDEHLRRVITHGGTAVGKSAQMPAWGGILSEDDVDLLVGYLHTLWEEPTVSEAP